MPPQLLASLAAYGKPSGVDLDELRRSESEGLLQEIAGQRGRLWHALAICEDSDDWSTAVRYHAGITKNLDLTAKVVGEIQTGHQTTVQNLIIQPAYLELRSALIKALQHHPEARRAVAQTLRELEGAPVHMTGIQAEKLEKHQIEDGGALEQPVEWPEGRRLPKVSDVAGE